MITPDVVVRLNGPNFLLQIIQMSGVTVLSLPLQSWNTINLLRFSHWEKEVTINIFFLLLLSLFFVYIIFLLPGSYSNTPLFLMIEYKYFRFFIGEEEYCRSIHIEVTTHYGDFALTTSSFVAYPSEVNINKIENGQQFQTSRLQILL